MRTSSEGFAIAVIWILSSACSSGSGSSPGEPARAPTAKQGSAIDAAAPAGAAIVPDAASAAPLPSAADPTAAKRAPCLADPDPDPDDQWLEAAVVEGVLRICAVGFYRESGSPEEGTRRDTCVGIDLSSGAPVSVANQRLAEQAEPDGSLSRRDGKLFGCAADGTCRALGKRLTRAIGAIEAKDPDTYIRVSADGALAIIDTGRPSSIVWDIAKDRRLSGFVPPEMESIYHDSASYRFFGDLIVGTWAPCAGPCYESRVYRRDRKIVVPQVNVDAAMIRLRDGRLAVLRDKLAIYDPKRARRVRAIDVIPPELERMHGHQDEPIPDPLVELVDGSVAVVVRSDEAVEVAVTDVNRGQVTRRLRAPVCAR